MKILITTPSGIDITTVLYPAQIGSALANWDYFFPNQRISWREFTGEIPQDRTFRKAWRDSGTNIVIDNEMAKEICREVLSARGALSNEARLAIDSAKTTQELKTLID